ncbi:proteasome subunit beta [Candidatus Pacearchaeota archaeon]|nr:proteasome subunit beta [Candidatus Pacearchaeota archaeon]
MPKDIEKEVVQTGTTTVGVICKDGIVLAADKRATLGDSYFIAHKKVQKVFKVSDNIVVTVAGVVSDIQLILKVITAELKLKAIRGKRPPTVKEAANLFASILYENIRKFSSIVGVAAFIIGGKDSEGFSLYEASPDGSVNKYDNFVTTGAYGSIMGYGILENEWREDMSLEEARKMALKVITTAIKRDASVGEGFDYVTIDKNGVGEIKEELIDEKKKK